MPKVSLSQAERDTGVPLPTLSRWRAKGKFSAEPNPHGQGWLVDTVEYDRIADLKKASSQLKPPERGSVREDASLLDTPDETLENSLQDTIDLQVLREKDKLKDERIKELVEDRDKWRNQAEKLLLTAHVPNSESGGEDNKSDPQTKKEHVQKPKNYNNLLIAAIIILSIVASALYMHLNHQSIIENLANHIFALTQ